VLAFISGSRFGLGEAEDPPRGSLRTAAVPPATKATPLGGGEFPGVRPGSPRALFVTVTNFLRSRDKFASRRTTSAVHGVNRGAVAPAHSVVRASVSAWIPRTSRRFAVVGTTGLQQRPVHACTTRACVIFAAFKLVVIGDSGPRAFELRTPSAAAVGDTIGAAREGRQRKWFVVANGCLF